MRKKKKRVLIAMISLVFFHFRRHFLSFQNSHQQAKHEEDERDRGR